MTVTVLVVAGQRLAPVTVHGHDQPFERVPHVAGVRHVIHEDVHVVEQHQETGEQDAQARDDRTDEHSVLKRGRK